MDTAPFLLEVKRFRLIFSFQNPSVLEIGRIFGFDILATVNGVGFIVETGDDDTQHALFVFTQNRIVAVVLHPLFQRIGICLVFKTSNDHAEAFEPAGIFAFCRVDLFGPSTDIAAGCARFGNGCEAAL